MSDNLSSWTKQYAEFASMLRQEGHLNEAAAYYIAAARGWLMGFRRPPERAAEDNPLKYPDTVKLAYGLREHMYGALSYRFGGQIGRCQNQCQQGILLLEELRDYDPFGKDDARKGICWELIGDYRVIGSLDQHDLAYERAAEYYETVPQERHHNWSGEPEFSVSIMEFINIAKSTGIEFDDQHYKDISTYSLMKRINTKHDLFPEIINSRMDMNDFSDI